ncbi:DUF4184 family protein [Streptomyces sp. NPDC004126]|uniref:DUF4184 family protein n=1 Tax=Streptomyces sp. NPDC004126 TaxID=3390695 RepID=UPI003D023701
MPYTLAHPAAVIPLCRRPLLPSALVAGAIAPDVGVLPDPWPGFGSHDWAGTFTVDLAVGLLLLAIWQSLLKRPLLDLAPRTVRARLAPAAAAFPWRSPAMPGWVVVSIVLGACSHVLWDQFTHGDLFSLGGYRQLVQDGSTVVAFLVMGWHTVRQVRRSPAAEPPLGFGRRGRIAARGVLAAVAVLASAHPLFFPPDQLAGNHLTGLPLLWWNVVNAAVVGLGSTVLAAFAYSLVWQAHRIVVRKRPGGRRSGRGPSAGAVTDRESGEPMET